MNRLTRILLATLTGLGLLFGLVAVGAPAAVAAKPTPYVTKAEFKQVRRGMTMNKVHRIFDVTGKQTSYMSGYPGKWGWPATQSREYKAKSKFSYVSVDYKKVNGTWKVTGKTAFWW